MSPNIILLSHGGPLPSDPYAQANPYAQTLYKYSIHRQSYTLNSSCEVQFKLLLNTDSCTENAHPY